jgi:exopolyphosphatase/pppGpp-phosphohydrolase
MHAKLQTLYRAARAASPPGRRLAVLHLGEDQSGVALGSGTVPDQIMLLALGLERTARTFFKHTPPLPLEIENAIQVVEDEVMAARAAALGQPLLFTSDATIVDMAHIAGNFASDNDGNSAGVNLHMSLEQVEQLFNQLAARSQGRPASQTDIPDDLRFSAALLILREFMHHLQFQRITILG